MQLSEFLTLSTRNIIVWSVVVFAVAFLLGFEDDGSSAQASASPVTGLAIAPISLTDCGDSVCSYPETQLDCPLDCTTAAGISYLVAEGDEASVWVEFRDSRYRKGQSVQIDLTIAPENVSWTGSNGCFLGGAEMGPEPRNGVVGWPSSTVSEDGYFRMEAVCKLPDGVGKGAHRLLASTDIIF